MYTPPCYSANCYNTVNKYIVKVKFDICTQGYVA